MVMDPHQYSLDLKLNHFECVNSPEANGMVYVGQYKPTKETMVLTDSLANLLLNLRIS